jgi:hypothetical protein
MRPPQCSVALPTEKRRCSKIGRGLFRGSKEDSPPPTCTKFVGGMRPCDCHPVFSRLDIGRRCRELVVPRGPHQTRSRNGAVPVSASIGFGWAEKSTIDPGFGSPCPAGFDQLDYRDGICEFRRSERIVCEGFTLALDGAASPAALLGAEANERRCARSEPSGAPARALTAAERLRCISGVGRSDPGIAAVFAVHSKGERGGKPAFRLLIRRNRMSRTLVSRRGCVRTR